MAMSIKIVEEGGDLVFEENEVLFRVLLLL